MEAKGAVWPETVLEWARVCAAAADGDGPREEAEAGGTKGRISVLAVDDCDRDGEDDVDDEGVAAMLLATMAATELVPAVLCACSFVMSSDDTQIRSITTHSTIRAHGRCIVPRFITRAPRRCRPRSSSSVPLCVEVGL